MTALEARQHGGEVVARVLVVDDDAGLRSRIRSFLGQHFIQVDEASDGERGLAALANTPVDAVLLDVMMPGVDGIEVVTRIRASSDVAVIMLSAKDTETDRVLALELGADDYIAKPFRPRELLSRLRAVLRRTRGTKRNVRLSAGGIEIDTLARTASIDRRMLELSGVEFDILAALMRSRGTVLARDTLLAEAGRNQVTITERTVDVHVSRLRKKLGDDPRWSRLIKTIHGVGYVFVG